MENNKAQKINQGIVDLSPKLVPLVQRMFLEGEISFNSDKYLSAKSGHSWVLEKNKKGKFIVDYYKKDPFWYFEVSKKISDDYQKVIKKYIEEYKIEDKDIFEEGQKELIGNLFKWSGPIIEEGLINYKEVFLIIKEFEKLINSKGAEFFNYAHGNIIGDHIFVDEYKIPYLLGMRITIKPGNGYYDFLRSLDWIFLKSESTEKNFAGIVNYMKKYTADYNWQEVGLVFSLRAIGILGWDMLHRGDYGAGDVQKKIYYLLKFVKRDY